MSIKKGFNSSEITYKHSFIVLGLFNLLFSSCMCFTLATCMKYIISYYPVLIYTLYIILIM